MATSYEKFYESFLSKILEYKYININNSIIENEVNKYLYSSISQFKNYCKLYNFNDRDDFNAKFNFDIDENIIDEVVDIVSDGMVVSWFNRYICNSDNLENVLTTKDFSMYSPANLNLRNRETYETLRKNFINKMRDFSFNHNDIGDFHSG